jgi:hypothetical protein
MLKNRFQSLKELRFQISSKKMHRYVTLWVICCLILHNLIIRIEESAGTLDINEWFDDNPGEPDAAENGLNEDEGEADGNPEERGEDDIADNGLLFRQRVMDDLLHSLQL